MKYFSEFASIHYNFLSFVSLTFARLVSIWHEGPDNGMNINSGTIWAYDSIIYGANENSIEAQLTYFV